MDEYSHPEPDQEDRASKEPGKAEEAPKRKPPSRLLIWGSVFVGLVLIVTGTLFWLDSRHYESTDDAFVDGHVSQVSAQISGRVTRLLVADNETVQQGQALLEIDPRDAQMRLDQALAQRIQAAAQLEQARASLPVRRADAGQAEAQVRVAEADLFQAQRDLNRYHAINPQAITKQSLDNATAATRSSQAKLEASRQALVGMRAQIAAAQSQVDAAQAAVGVQDAAVADARLQLSYTRVLAPASGRVTKRTVEVGLYVQPGQSLLAVVQTDMWVTANFKEAQLADMHQGQPVRIRVDAFPDAKLSGRVDSLQAGTGSIFSSLPAENATGNYVKVVQRLPVKIMFDGDGWRHVPIAPGMSVTPRVTVR